jgi:hypothetical protein
LARVAGRRARGYRGIRSSRPRRVLESFVRAVLSNFTVTCLVLALVAAALTIACAPAPRGRDVVREALLRWYVVFCVGVGMLYNFVMHVFFGESTARFIGWADSPFQTEVGLASLGFAAVGFLAFRGDAGMRLAAILGPACFLVGAGVGHLYQIATSHNLAPGNAGSVLYTDFLVPAAGFALWWLRYRAGGAAGSSR